MGPDLTNQLIGVLTRFPHKEVAVVADERISRYLLLVSIEVC